MCQVHSNLPIQRCRLSITTNPRWPQPGAHHGINPCQRNSVAPWEAFNLLNRVRFGTGPRTLTDPNLGRLTSNSDLLNSPRTMQFGLKFYF